MNRLIHTETIRKIIDEAMDILERVGVLVENKAALQLLADAGAVVKFTDQKAIIRRELIEAALKTVPHSIVLYDLNGQPVVYLEGDQIQFDPGSAALNILDYNTMSVRHPESADLVNFIRLTEKMPYIAAQSTGLIPFDVPEEIGDRYRLYLALQYSRKPVVTGTFQKDGFQVMHDFLVTVRGSAQALRQKPLAIFDCCPSPPLKWSDLTCQSLIDAARAGVPAELVSMPLTGGTAPVTLAGSLVQHTAENLSGIVIHQLAGPGAPIIYGGSPAAMDMRAGTTPMGAIETMMIDSGYAQIGKYLGLPTHAYMGLSDAKVVDAQAGFETGIGAILAALAGINMISGAGMLDFESCQSLEKLVIDNEICGMALRLVKGIRIRPGRLAPELLGDIYAGDHFLTSEQTIQLYREEIHLPGKVVDRQHPQMRDLLGSSDIGTRAHALVQELLAPEPEIVVSAEIQSELKKIMHSNARKYGMDKLPV